MSAPAAVAPLPADVAAVAALPSCRQVSLSLDGEGGAFDGMSHGGALLVVRNTGPDCRLPGLPALAFFDARGRALPIARRAPAGLHPGPAVPPLGVASGAEATAPLRWVSGPVYPHSRCLTPARLVLTLAPGVTQTYAGPIGRACGPSDAPAPLTQPPLRLDPRLIPPPSAPLSAPKR